MFLFLFILSQIYLFTLLSSWDFHNQQGDWIHAFEDPLPPIVTGEQLEVNNKDFTFDQVQEWIEGSDGIAGRFRFYEAFGKHSEFYQRIAKPLLSMRTVGSIDVEHRIKPVKHEILTKKRNRLLDP